MPRFFFHIRTRDGQFLKDPEGQEFANLQAVEDDAMASAKEILAEGLLAGKPVLTGDAFEIFDEREGDTDKHRLRHRKNEAPGRRLSCPGPVRKPSRGPLRRTA